LRVVLAGTPGAPASAAVRDATVTSATTLRVTYSPPADGGSPITNYEVQIDDGVGGGFATVAGGAGAAYLRQYFVA
jgi:hypothetical protein